MAEMSTWGRVSSEDTCGLKAIVEKNASGQIDLKPR